MFTALLIVAAVAGQAPGAAPVMVLPGERPTYEALLAREARAADARFAATTCPDAAVQLIETRPITIASQPDFAAAIERVKVTGCGRSTIENLHVGRFGGSPPWRMVASLPGDSIAEISLQESAAPQALAEARVELPPECVGASLGETYVAAWPGKVDLGPVDAAPPRAGARRLRVQLPPNLEPQRQTLDPARAWAEVWPLNLCGHDRTTMVVFLPLREQPYSVMLFMPVWRDILAHGPGARPAHAPPGD